MASKGWNVAMVLLGVAGLLLQDRYAGPGVVLVHSYGGNVTASFATYFVAANLAIGHRWRRWIVAGLALAAVWGFEATDGFWVMSNVYDPWDFVADAVGIGVALGVDGVVARASQCP